MHLALGLVIWLTFLGIFIYVNPLTLESFINFSATTFILASLGAVLPDIDTAHSHIGMLLQSAVLFGSFALSFMYFANGIPLTVDSVDSLIPILKNAAIVTAAMFVLFMILRPQHRGATHTIRASIVYGTMIFL